MAGLSLLVPGCQAPFPLTWGFTTRHTQPEQLPSQRLFQVHGCRVHAAQPEATELIHGDGLWTMTPGLRIGIRVADCVPVLLAGLAQGRPWVAALHAGWKGAVGGILREGIEAFQGQGGHPAELAYAFGPCIQACHFEVGPEVIAQASLDPAWHPGLVREGQGDRAFLDLHGLLRSQAAALGLDPAREGSVARCTRCEPELFYSYRGGDINHRQWGMVQIDTGL